MFSGNQIKRLGKRLRYGDYAGVDLQMLDEYRRTFDGLLLHTAHEISTVLRSDGITGVVAGRSKRTKSIIRKLRRPENRGMDLSRMDDLVGTRIIVQDLEEQQKVVDLLKARVQIKREHQYLIDSRQYRAVHLVAHDQNQLIEIQIRTIAQQLWANESESFGEEVKEGGGMSYLRDYLTELSAACREIDKGADPSTLITQMQLMKSRGTLSVQFPRLRDGLLKAAKLAQAAKEARSYIIVYDNALNQCLQQFVYGSAERDTALKEYPIICKDLDETRYEVLILNSGSEEVIRVTHPRFFPE